MDGTVAVFCEVAAASVDDATFLFAACLCLGFEDVVDRGEAFRAFLMRLFAIGFSFVSRSGSLHGDVPAIFWQAKESEKVRFEFNRLALITRALL